MFLASRPGAALQVVVLAIAALLIPGAAWLSPMAIALIAVALLWLAGDDWRSAGFGRPTRRAFWWLTIAVVIGLAWQYAASGFVVPFISQRLGASAPSMVSAGARLPSGSTGFVFSLIVFGIIHPLAGALAYRAFLLSRLERLLGATPSGLAASLIVGSVLFGLGNAYQGWAGFLATALTGVVLNLLYYWARRNVWPSALAHAVYNISAIILLSL